MIKSTGLISLMGLLAITTSLPLLADTLKVDMKPGLWEHRIKLIGGNDLAAQTEQMQQAMEEVKKQTLNILELLEDKRVEHPDYVSVEINDQIIPKDKYNEYQIKDGDRIEFLYYMGGGNKVQSFRQRRIPA